MKKISLKTIRKSFNIKGKEENEFAVSQPELAASFTAEDSLFGGCYSKDLVSSDLENEDEKRSKVRSKSEGLMGSLKRRLSAKQKPKVKGGSPSVCSIDDDTFSSSSAPITLSDIKSQHSSRSTSIHSHHYSPTPWPLRPVNSEETCIKMDVKALMNSSDPSPALNSVHQDFLDLQREFKESSDSLKITRRVPDHHSGAHNDDLHLEMDEHIPVVIGLAAQDYIQYTMPLDDGLFPDNEGSRSFCLDGTTPMDVIPQSEGCRSLHADEEPIDQD
uniref:Suppressor of cytokine signaling 6b n=1 Tax=Cyprinus carpio TaxID=7962 RepID=A0A8C2FEL1_CYPCA